MKDAIAKEADDLNIMYFKLVSGDEVISLINRNKPNETVILVEQPLQLINTYINEKSYTVSFQEWAPIAHDNIIAILRSNIVAYSKCTKESKERYLRTVIDLAQGFDPNDNTEDELDFEMPADTNIH